MIITRPDLTNTMDLSCPWENVMWGYYPPDRELETIKVVNAVWGVELATQYQPSNLSDLSPIFYELVNFSSSHRLDSRKV